MAKDEEFSGTSYTLDYGPAKDKMFYVFVAYVSAMIIGILYVIWRLRGKFYLGINFHGCIRTISDYLSISQKNVGCSR